MSAGGTKGKPEVAVKIRLRRATPPAHQLGHDLGKELTLRIAAENLVIHNVELSAIEESKK